ncbi:MAG TPA: sporadic carbohydrate cluster 2OG-Fe(II) oxygenase [Telmatospirillum sp.]|nr:sporadic carbohydrate cluster 2OG-Fe(II) oxygenase [Telmatospirillum sp.]
MDNAPLGPWSCLPEDEAKLCARFMAEGHVVFSVSDLACLKALRDRAATLAAAHLGIPVGKDAGTFLDSIHRHIDPARLNALRLHVIRGLNDAPHAHQQYHALGRGILETIAGNELAMQRRLNLSIQLPDDDSSLLPVHADVWSGDSPFEVVLWVPLVDCHATKSMYLLPPDANTKMQARLAEFAGRSSEDLYQAIADRVSFLDVPYGKALLFSQNLMHGNRINRETTTRWSINCRFKALLAPFGDKRLGEFFEPLVIRPVTRLGMQYTLPRGLDE